MKIVQLSTYHAAPRWLFLKIETDEGITGWGEPVSYTHLDVYKRQPPRLLIHSGHWIDLNST